MARPILILQIHRMGDVIMSFPLCVWLAETYPGRPIWMAVAWKDVQGLQKLCPFVRFISFQNKPWRSREFHLVINLSTRREAAEIAGGLVCDELLGQYARDGNLYIRGNWHLYRSSLIHNSRHNRFHWSELFALDAAADAVLRHKWPAVSIQARPRARIGLFLGASQKEKRPLAAFWVDLAKKLLSQGRVPVLLGGASERRLSREVARRIPVRTINLCGQTDISGLVGIFQTLSLMVTPDTGPMHLAAWTGLPVINISMGPVCAWDTGPFFPGQWILRAKTSCHGCWACHRPSLLCRQQFEPSRTAALIGRMLMGRSNGLSCRGVDVYRATRDDSGLYHLEPAGRKTTPGARELIALFWKDFFFHVLGPGPKEQVQIRWDSMRQSFPQLAVKMADGRKQTAVQLGKYVRSGRQSPDPDFWKGFPPMIRPLTSYIQQVLDNGDHGPQALDHCLSLIGALPFGK